MFWEGALVLLLINHAVAQGGPFDTNADGGIRPWMKTDIDNKKGPKVPEDHVIANLNEKKKITFECPIAIEDASTVFATWYRLTKSGAMSDLMYEEGKYDFLTFTSFTIENLNSKDEGTYICREGDQYGPIIKKFSLIIMEALETTETPGNGPPVWLYVPKRIVRANSKQLFIARCAVAEPEGVKITVYRLRDDKEILKQFKDPAVVLHRPDVDDAGYYKCVAENSQGRIEYQFEVTIRVNGRYGKWEAWGPCDKECGLGFKTRNRQCDSPAPSGGGRDCTGESFQRLSCRSRSCQKPFLKKFGFEITKEGLHLSCKASGIPTPSVQWYFNGRRFPMSYDAQNPEFKIPKPKARSGSYSCRIRNHVGFMTMYITIKV
uniref:Ig-like domain-containing protein n=1 Tax=Clytia hemisphaerica TaxID=252671 RepID=A0A7M5VAC4_9CNID